jgi:hypothetical protein
VLERLPLDAGRLLDRARASRAEACVLAALETARRMIGATVPSALGGALRAKASGRLLRRIDAFRDAPPTPRSLAAWRLSLVGARRLELMARTLGRKGAFGRGLVLLRRLAV